MKFSNERYKFITPKEIRKGVETKDSFEHMMIASSLEFPEDFDTNLIVKITTYRVPNIEYKQYNGIKVKKVYRGPVILIDIPIAKEGFDSMLTLIGQLKDNKHFLEYRSLERNLRFIYMYPEALIGKTI